MGQRGIYFYDAGTKAVELLDTATHTITRVAKPQKDAILSEPGLAVSPDERYILFAHLDHIAQHIMLVENFPWSKESRAQS